jgi:hypothetical protein
MDRWRKTAAFDRATAGKGSGCGDVGAFVTFLGSIRNVGSLRTGTCLGTGRVWGRGYFSYVIRQCLSPIHGEDELFAFLAFIEFIEFVRFLGFMAFKKTVVGSETQYTL